MVKKNTTVPLALFLGTIGAQFFNLGKAGWGIINLLLYWSFIPTLIGLYDFFRFSFESAQRFNIRYNGGVYVMNNSGSVADELQKLGKFRQEGILTQEEFETRKKQVLRRS